MQKVIRIGGSIYYDKVRDTSYIDLCQNGLPDPSSYNPPVQLKEIEGYGPNPRVGGRVYVFRHVKGSHNWVLDVSLENADNININDTIGSGMIENTWLPSYSPYEPQYQNGESAPGSMDQFGYSVGIDGSFIVVGSPNVHNGYFDAALKEYNNYSGIKGVYLIYGFKDGSFNRTPDFSFTNLQIEEVKADISLIMYQ